MDRYASICYLPEMCFSPNWSKWDRAYIIAATESVFNSNWIYFILCKLNSNELPSFFKPALWLWAQLNNQVSYIPFIKTIRYYLMAGPRLFCFSNWYNTVYICSNSFLSFSTVSRSSSSTGISASFIKSSHNSNWPCLTKCRAKARQTNFSLPANASGWYMTEISCLNFYIT